MTNLIWNYIIELRSAIKHEMKLEEMRDKLRERVPLCKINFVNILIEYEKKERVFNDEIHKNLINECGYLNKVDKI